jgi:maltose O-acetyltransferase
MLLDILNRFRQFRRDRYVQMLVSRGLKLGKDVYLNDGFFLDPDHCHLITIEEKVVFGPSVKVFAHDASSLKVIGKTKVCLIHLKRNCFIGANCVVLPGAVVGENSILGAGSVLNATIPDNEVWAGCPAKFLMTVEEYRQRLLRAPAVDFPHALFRMNVLTLDRRAEMIERLQATPLGFMID